MIAYCFNIGFAVIGAQNPIAHLTWPAREEHAHSDGKSREWRLAGPESQELDKHLLLYAKGRNHALLLLNSLLSLSRCF
jgi:hypothetical protein